MCHRRWILMETMYPIDRNKGFYESPEIAKYVYYCALSDLDSIPIPADPRSVLKKFEVDLYTWRKSIEKEIDSITDEDKYREKLLTLRVTKLNYSVINYES